jgi:ketosteroid isomerase-like protein
MSQENVNIVRLAHAEFERGNFWVPELFHPDVRIVWLSAINGQEETTVGLAGMSRVVVDWVHSWEQVTLVAEQFVDAGDQVVVIGDWKGRGKASGVAVAWRHGAVWTLREGKATSVVSYSDADAALQAVGLSG